jgi:hypothetical protein
MHPLLRRYRRVRFGDRGTIMLPAAADTQAAGDYTKG